MMVPTGFTKTATGLSSGLRDRSVVTCGLSLPYISHFINYTTIAQFADFLYSISAIIFGLTSWFSSFCFYVIFTTIFQLLLRIGCALLGGVINAIVLALYPDHWGVASAFSQISFEVGYILGPPFGQQLFDFGGFSAPFLVTGSVGFGLAILSIFFMIPHSVELPKEELSLVPCNVQNIEFIVPEFIEKSTDYLCWVWFFIHSIFGL